MLQVYDQSGWDLFSQTAVVGMCDLEHPAAQTPTNPPKSRKEREREKRERRRGGGRRFSHESVTTTTPTPFFFFLFLLVLFCFWTSNPIPKKFQRKKSICFTSSASLSPDTQSSSSQTRTQLLLLLLLGGGLECFSQTRPLSLCFALLCRQQSCVGPLMSPTQNQASPNQCRLVLTCWPVLGLVTQYLPRLPVLNF